MYEIPNIVVCTQQFDQFELLTRFMHNFNVEITQYGNYNIISFVTSREFSNNNITLCYCF